MGVKTLVLLTMVIAAGVETCWGGTYEIRLDRQVLEQVRHGKAFRVRVNVEDRKLRRFRIRGDQGSQGWIKLNSENVGWRTSAGGQMDYLVQLVPEQIEQLMSGTSFVAEVFPRVENLANIYVFLGKGQLPRVAAATAMLESQSKADHLRVAADHLDAAGFASEAGKLRNKADAMIIAEEIAKADEVVTELGEVVDGLETDEEMPEVEALREKIEVLLKKIQAVSDKLSNNELVMLETNEPRSDRGR